MNELYWCLRLSMEVLKLNFIVFKIFGGRQIKNPRQLKILVIGMLIASSFVIDQVSEDVLDVVFISVLMIIYFLLLQKKSHIAIVIFGFIGISIIDVLIAGVVCLFLGYSAETAMTNRFIISVLNSISLIILFVVITITQIRRKEKMELQGKFDKSFIKSLLLIYAGLLCLIIYVVPIQYFSLISADEEARVSSLLGVTFYTTHFIIRTFF